ncbi:MAG: DNA primase small subunit domain-containing protein [Fervidicoccaceae archaeon]
MRRERPREKSIGWIKKKLIEYYSSNVFELPDNLSSREFAVQPLTTQSYIRHLSFKSERELRDYILKNPPLHLYYSSALYLFPEVREMESKGYIGSELIFDIDVDELSSCRLMEQLHVCLDCGHLMYGNKIKKCLKCGSQNVVEASPVSDECMKKGGEAALMLARILRKDFGFDEVRIYFSGNRGFHVRPLCDDECLKLNGEERREIVDYIKGVGLDLDKIAGFGKKEWLVPSPDEPGWRGRIGEAIYNKFGIKYGERITWSELQKKADVQELKSYISSATVEIDEKVTVDVHRLIRIPGSINGKLGLPVIKLNEADLSNFSIRCELSPFKEKVKVKMNVTITDKTIMGVKMSVYKGEEEEIPGCLAFPFILKGLADVS